MPEPKRRKTDHHRQRDEVDRDLCAQGAVVLEGHAPGGFWGRITGLDSNSVMHFVLIGLMLGLLYMIYSGETERAMFRRDMYRILSEHKEMDVITQTNQALILKSVAAVGEEQKATT